MNDVTLQPILTLPDRLAEEREKLDTNLRSKQTGRVTLDVGGRYSATNKGTLSFRIKTRFSMCFWKPRKSTTLLTGMALISYIS